MGKEGGHRARPSRGAGGRSPMKHLLCLIPCVHRHVGKAKEHQLKASVPSEEPSEPATGTDNGPVREKITHDGLGRASEQHTFHVSAHSAQDTAPKGSSGVRPQTPSPAVRAALPAPPPYVPELHVDPVEAGGAPVTVAVMVRPLSTSEKAAKARHRVFVQRPGSVQMRALRFGGSTAGQDEYVFEADRVYVMAGKEHAAQLFQEMVAPAITGSFLHRVNTLVMAYGAAGTGKTSVLGMRRVFAGGVFSMAVQAMWRELAAVQAHSRIGVEVSFIELHRNQIRDLLTDEDNSVRLRECPVNGPYVENITELRVSDADEVMQALAAGVGRRTTLRGPQGQRRSSRCHMIFTVNLMQRRLVADGRGPADSASKLVFCDLAACEPVRNGAAAGRGGGKAAADAAHVSKSLLALGNVISAASNPRRNNGHVPYRDSLLTRILQDCPGKATHTVLLACVSAADICHEQTLQTLRFAERARSRNLPVMGLAAPNEEAYLQRLLTVQQQDRLAAMALADAPALPQLHWEGDVPQGDSHQQTETEQLSCIVPSSAPCTLPAAAAAVGNDGGSHLQLITMTPDRAHHDDAVNHAAGPAASSARSSKAAGQEPPVPTEEAQRRTRQVSKRRDSSRSDASGTASLGGSSSGRSETTARIRFHAAAASKSHASEALEPPTPDQVSTRPQSAQRMATGASMTGEELLPATPLEHETYRSVEAAIRQLHMEPGARVRKRTRAPEIDLSID